MKQNNLIIGLMRTSSLNYEEFEKLMFSLLNRGLNYFDLADIYNGGRSEELISEFLEKHSDLRDKIIIQTKIGIKINEGYDLGKDYLKLAIENSLKRLKINYIDVLLLHRPDIFFNNEEVAEVVNDYMDKGIIKHFGVSNFSKEAIIYLNKYLKNKIEINQLQLGLGHLNLIAEPLNFNVSRSHEYFVSDDLFYFLKNNNIKLQCWSPFQYGYFEGVIFDENKFSKLNEKLYDLAVKYHATKAGIATSFLTSLDKNVSVISGSMNIEHIIEMDEGRKIILSKKDWYDLYKSALYFLP